MSSRSSKFSKTKRRQIWSGGFTLIEMVTVMAIFVIMTSVVLANLPDFRDRSSLELVAQEMALVVRQAQAFGTRTRGAVFSEEVRFPSYGIYFNTGDVNLSEPSETSFILFADAPEDGDVGDNNYGGPGEGCGADDSECREVFNLKGGLELDKEGPPPGPLALCDDSGCTSVSALNIVFNRPNPEARFTDPANSGSEFSLCSGAPCQYAKIILTLVKNGATKSICVWSTGHIYSRQSCP